MARSAAPSPEDLATLQDRFDELQASVDVFSSTLERLASARRGPNRNSVQSRELPPSAGRVHGVGSTGVMCAGHIRCDGLSSVTRGDSMAGVPVAILVLVGASIVAVIVQSLRQRKVRL